MSSEFVISAIHLSAIGDSLARAGDTKMQDLDLARAPMRRLAGQLIATILCAVGLGWPSGLALDLLFSVKWGHRSAGTHQVLG